MGIVVVGVRVEVASRTLVGCSLAICDEGEVDSMGIMVVRCCYRRWWRKKEKKKGKGKVNRYVGVCRRGGMV